MAGRGNGFEPTTATCIGVADLDRRDPVSVRPACLMDWDRSAAVGQLR